MSKVINKKLHPYYKTGIYGWFGEEVDDNDYIICPICGEVLGMNYCDYAGEQGYDNRCPKCKQELDYSEIYDFEDTCYFEQLLEIKEIRFAELEAKLAEKDRQLKVMRELKNRHFNYYKTCETECNQLKQQLAGKEADLIALDTDNYSFKQQIDNLRQQLSEKDNETTIFAPKISNNADLVMKIIVLDQEEIDFTKELNQDKISFAVAYLELLKAFIIDKEFYFVGEDYSTVYVEDITEEIDNQIKAIKGEK